MTASRRPRVESVSQKIESLEQRVCLSAVTPPVFAPSNFQAVALSDHQVKLTWVDNSVNEINFLIERSTNGTTWTPVVSAPKNSLLYIDGSVEPGTEYFYRIKAHAKGANSDIVALDSSIVTPAPSGAFAFVDADSGQLDILGTEGDDIIEVSASGPNVFVKLNGVQVFFPKADVTRVQIYGLVGNDRIVTGNGVGNVNISGGDGNDTCLGNSGDDRIDGGNGDDILRGLFGNDTLIGGDGKDTLWGGLGNDFLDGGNGNDRLIGEDGNDTLLGDNGNDRLVGGEGLDSMVGGRGDNILST